MSIHPLEQSFKKLRSLREDSRSWLLTNPDSQSEWFSVADLATENHLHVVELFRRLSLQYKAASLRPLAALWFGHYAYAIEAVAIACFMIEGRVPDLSPDQIWIRLEMNGNIANIAWRGRSFAALTDDPDTSHADCRIFPTREALRDHLRKGLIASFTPVIEAVSVYSSFGKPGLWALAADYTAYVFSGLGEGNESIGVEESRLFSATKTKVSVKRDFIPIEHLGTIFYFLERTSCCQYYKVEGGGYCSSCPHRPLDERIALEKSYMEEEAAATKT